MSNISQQNPEDIMQAATALNQLNSALAADLSVTFDPAAMVQVRIAAANGSQVTLHLLGHEVSEFISEFIQEKLAKLQMLGVATDGILEQYKQAGQQAAQALQSQQQASARNEKTS